MATNSAPLDRRKLDHGGRRQPADVVDEIGAARERAARRLDVVGVDAEPRPQQLAAIAVDEAAERGLEPRPFFVGR